MLGKLTSQERKEFFCKEENRKRMEANKKILDEIWDELMELIRQIKLTNDSSALKILHNRERVLIDKYCSCNGIDETLTNNF